MPDTKSGREKKGLNKESQLLDRLHERELRTLEGEEEEPPQVENVSGEFLADELPDG